MLALGRRRLRHGTVWLCRRRRCGRGGLEATHIAASRKREGRTQQNGRSPKATASSPLAPSHTSRHVSYSWLSKQLSPAKYVDLSHPEHLDAGATARLDHAADPNSLIFEGLGRKPRRLEGPHHAP